MSIVTTVLLLAAAALAARTALSWWRGVLRMARMAASIPGPAVHPLRLGNLLDLPCSRLRSWFQVCGRGGRGPDRVAHVHSQRARTTRDMGRSEICAHFPSDVLSNRQ